MAHFRPFWAEFLPKNFRRQKFREAKKSICGSKNVLKPKFRWKTDLQALKDSKPARFVIFGRFRPIYRHFIFLKKVDFGHFSMWPILAENSAEKWPDTKLVGSKGFLKGFMKEKLRKIMKFLKKKWKILFFYFCL